MSDNLSVTCETCGAPPGVCCECAGDAAADDFYAENTRLAAENEALSTRVRELELALAGNEGELMGLRVSAGFFQQRAEVLEAAAMRKLTPREQQSLQGCCPFCGVTVGEYVERIAGERDAALAECARMRSVFDLAKRWCRRPVSCLREGQTVLANDAEMFAKLHAAIDDAEDAEDAALTATKGDA